MVAKLSGHALEVSVIREKNNSALRSRLFCLLPSSIILDFSTFYRPCVMLAKMEKGANSSLHLQHKYGSAPAAAETLHLEHGVAYMAQVTLWSALMLLPRTTQTACGLL